MKKYSILLFFLIIGIICIGTVSASQVTVDGIKFNMVDGFSENSTKSSDAIPLSEVLNTYVKGNETIYIKTTSCNAENFDIDQETFDKSFEDTGAEEKTIKNKKGYYRTTDDGYYQFSYLSGVKIVSITVPDESYFEKIII